MILLDTNVVSALMKPTPDNTVLAWVNQQESEELFLSSITLAEIDYGLRILPEGRRRRDLMERFSVWVEQGFDRRLIAFDPPAATMYGELMAHRRSIGRPMSVLDGQIAAIARAYRMTVATRNTGDFEECGVEIVNPFDP